MLFIKLTRFQLSMAQQTGGYYTTLYVPDNVSESTYNTLLMEPSVVHTLDKIKQANITIHGIGDASRWRIVDNRQNR